MAARAPRRPVIRMLLVTDSSNVMAVGYDRELCLLRVRFRDGSEYDYSDVGSAVYTKLIAAPSIGVHFAAHIRGGYKCERTRRPRARATAS